METVERRKIEGQNQLNRERAQPDPRAGGGGREGVCVWGPRWALGWQKHADFQLSRSTRASSRSRARRSSIARGVGFVRSGWVGRQLCQAWVGWSPSSGSRSRARTSSIASGEGFVESGCVVRGGFAEVRLALSGLGRVEFVQWQQT
jgi:hypothetical protein